MSQRNSGYERKERDLYETPEWVTECLLPHIPERIEWIWEPAAGSGKIARVLMLEGVRGVHQTDIYPSENLHAVKDFLMMPHASDYIDGICTNPPYETAREFIETSLDLMRQKEGWIAMLLRTDYDHAKTRQHLFSGHPAFAKKLVLTKRIVWFEGGKSPSFNHAWFIWDWTNEGPPQIAYGPEN
jgi:methylase of polypeptide subunit release factors